jgi:uncharacterized protein (UPF0332 family)
LSVGTDVLQLMQKATQASVSARLLLDAGDIDGACNRAYYAMFDAARAALIASKSPVQPEVARTHNGLIAAFGLHLVKPGLVANELGRIFNRAEEIRLVADYKGDSVELEDAREVVIQADRFVEAMRSQFFS